jgi:hypothetical protein
MKNSILLLLIVATTSAQAQSWHIGGNAGITLSNYKTKTPWKEVANMGYAFGISGYKQFNLNSGLSLELQYLQKGYFHKVCNEITDQLEASYVEVPFLYDYTFIIPSMQNWKMHLNVGGYTAYWISGKYKMEGFDETSEEFDFEANNASRFDFGVSGGGKVEYIMKNGSLLFNFRYEMGLVDLQKRVNDDASNTNRAWVIGVSYMKLLGQ